MLNLLLKLAFLLYKGNAEVPTLNYTFRRVAYIFKVLELYSHTHSHDVYVFKVLELILTFILMIYTSGVGRGV